VGGKIDIRKAVKKKMLSHAMLLEHGSLVVVIIN
jgi:hypothetical protein